MIVNTMRHDAVHNFITFNTPVNIIGCGATGSYTAIQLYKLGINPKLIHLWDGDVVESHNIANQYFDNSDVDSNKAEAIAARIPGSTAHAEMVTEQTKLPSGICFILTDTMSSRREIFESCIEYKFGMQHVFETRLDIDCFHVYSFDPNIRSEVSSWKNTLYSDEDAVSTTTSCGGTLTIGATVLQLVGNLIWAFIVQQSKINPTEFVKERWKDTLTDTNHRALFNVHDSEQTVFSGSWK